MEHNVQQGPKPNAKPQIGWCEYLIDGKPCGRSAIYTLDFDCDDMKADLCTGHHDTILSLVGLPNEDE